MPSIPARSVAASLVAVAAILPSLDPSSSVMFASAKLADRSRVNAARKTSRQRRKAIGKPRRRIVPDDGSDRKKRDAEEARNGARRLLPTTTTSSARGETKKREGDVAATGGGSKKNDNNAGGIRGAREQHQQQQQYDADQREEQQPIRRQLSSQLTGCCANYIGYAAMDMCSLYEQDCESGKEPSHDSSDADCSQAGLSFIGISFSVNTALGNPYSYQLCDQFPMENIIDRDYDYVMSMDEDGWLVGGGYKSFDYSGKMPYIDSSHTELLRIGSVDPEFGGTTIEQVYSAMDSLSFPPFAVFPEFVKGGGGHGSGDDGEDKSVPSGDVTLIVSVVDTYEDGDSYSTYEDFLDQLFDAMDAVGGGPCMDDHDTDPHVSMSRGVKFKSSYHQQKYFYHANLEVAVWQAMYPKGVIIGSSGYSSFPPGSGSSNKEYTGYGNLYFFFDRANITKAFHPNRDLTSTESYYADLFGSGMSDNYYQTTTTIDFDYNKQSGSGSGDNEQEYYEHNPYGWKAKMAKHDMTDGWDLPPSCDQEGETFFGIPLSQTSDSKLLSTLSFQNQFDFEYLTDRNFTYMQEFGTNHGWLVGETLGNGAGSIVDKDTAHIPIFYTGTTNPDMGGMSLESLIKIGKKLDFGTLYIKPAFVFQDSDGSIKLQFEADANSALGYLYSSLCQMIGISWNYDSPYNDLGLYTNCAMHAAGDRAKYGCGAENGNSGGFCPQMTLAYRVSFQSEEHAANYLAHCNDYVDYWRSLYPSGVAVGTGKFCPDGGCLALFLNRFDVFYVFKPELGGSWVEFMGGTSAPTISPAPTYDGGCDNPHNMHLDKCYRKKHARKATAVAWDSLGAVGQLSIFLIAFMSSTLTISIFLARAKRRRQDGESYLGFFIRDVRGKKKKKRKKLRKRAKGGRGTLDEDLLDDDDREGGEGGGVFRSVPARPGKPSKKQAISRPRPPRSSTRPPLSSSRPPLSSSRPPGSRSLSMTPSRSRSKSRSRPGASVDADDETVKSGKSGKSSKGKPDSVKSSRSRSRSKSRARSRSSSKRVKKKSEKEEKEQSNTPRRQLV